MIYYKHLGKKNECKIIPSNNQNLWNKVYKVGNEPFGYILGGKSLKNNLNCS